MSLRARGLSWRWVGVIGTVAYFAFVLLIPLLFHPTCRGNDPRFVCLKPNEIADVLAGVVAPVALLWVGLAVFVQSDELRAQREELKLTRMEYELSRQVLEAQVQEAKKQVEFVEQQTAILRIEQTDREAARFGDAYDRARTQCIKRILSMLHGTLFVRQDGTAHRFELSDWNLFSELLLGAALMNGAWALQKLREAPTIEVWREVLAALQTLPPYRPRLSDAMQLQFDADQIDFLIQHIQSIITNFEQEAFATAQRATSRQPIFIEPEAK